MKTTSTTQPSIFKMLSILIVSASLIYNGSLKAHPTTYASIGDFVWVDQNANGIQDAGEPGVANVTVKLINASGTVVATTTTNASGKYLFTNVYVPQPAQFRVQFGTPGQYTWTTKAAPGSTVTNNSNADANGLSDAFTVTQGDYNTCLDAGIRQTASGKATIGDFVWADKNGNGIQDAGEPGVANVTVKLINSAGTVVATTTTNASGIYFFSNVSISSCGQYRVQFGTPGQYTWTTKTASGSTVTNNSNADANGLTDEFTVCPGDYNTCIDAGIRQASTGKATIGDFVWLDKNGNGIQDAGEPGVANVTVKLINSAGTVVATTTTNASGNYFFVDVAVSACGQYKVQFGTPGQYTFTKEAAAGSTVTNNSNVDANGLTPAFTVCPGDYNTCIDAGILPTTTIGDFVWDDKVNQNGIQDAGEPGIPNVKVQLLNSAGAVVATTTTNSAGKYLFTVNITSCTQYKVNFVLPGAVFVPKHIAGSTAANDNDANPNGITDLFTVCPGDNNITIDAGICSSCATLPISLTKFDGSYVNGVAKLSWSSGFETPVTKFDVERSSNGTSFTTISTINGKGVNSGSSYTFNDNLPLNGNIYYRLKIFDGNVYQYSNIINLKTTIKGINVRLISANPFVNQIKINVATETAGLVNVILTDNLGRAINKQSVQADKGSNEISVNNVSNLGKGVYNLQVITGGQATNLKLMKD